MKDNKYGLEFHETMDAFVDPADFGINIEEIRNQIKSMRDKKSIPNNLKPEIFTKDTIDKYQNFAKEHLGFEFNDPRLFITALTHRSYVNEHRSALVEHNERLEFLGDAILEQVTSEFLFRYFDESEGIMTAWRSALVRTESIGAASRDIGYVPLIRLSRGAAKNPGRALDNIIADCFEAVTGAIFIDQGYLAAKRHIYEHILCKMLTAITGESWRDPKSHLQEMTQKTEGVIPQYHLKKVEGPDHERVFTIELSIGGEIYAVGTGPSKQLAQTIAAEEAIKKYQAKHPVDNGRLSSKGL